MNYYLVEFISDSVHIQYEEVSAINPQEAVNSIKWGWPEAKIYNVWLENNDWKDEV